MANVNRTDIGSGTGLSKLSGAQEEETIPKACIQFDKPTTLVEAFQALSTHWDNYGFDAGVTIMKESLNMLSFAATKPEATSELGKYPVKSVVGTNTSEVGFIVGDPDITSDQQYFLRASITRPPEGFPYEEAKRVAVPVKVTDGRTLRSIQHTVCFTLHPIPDSLQVQSEKALGSLDIKPLSVLRDAVDK